MEGQNPSLIVITVWQHFNHKPALVALSMLSLTVNFWNLEKFCGGASRDWEFVFALNFSRLARGFICRGPPSTTIARRLRK